MNKYKPIQEVFLNLMHFTLSQALLILLLSTVAYSASVHGQEILERKVSLHVQNKSVKAILNALSKQAKVRFTYSPKLIDSDRKVSVDSEAVSLRTVLEQVLHPSVTYEILGDEIILKSGPETSADDHQEMGQFSSVITGIITDEKNEPLPGVNVIVKNAGQGTSTDRDGRFSLEVEDGNAVLVISFIGYASQELIVGNKTTFEIQLEPEIQSLQEVIVVGYGTVKKSDLTGSVSKVGDKDIKSVPVVAFDRAMQGRAAGVLVTTNSARPGGSTTIRIRGTGSVNASNEPLYVIDGYPISDLNTINPNDIESMEILKDASATAIYGSRGSNGVVLVTTKRGTAGKSSIEFDSYYGVQTVRREIPLLNAREYAEFVNEARVNNGGLPYFDGSAADRPLPQDITTDTDWQDEVFQSAPIQNYQLSMSGGENKTRYAISFNYFDQDGIILNSYFQRYTLRANIDRDISERLKVGVSIQGAFTKSNASRTESDGGANSGVTNAALNYAPVLSVYNPDGSFNRYQGPLNGNLVDNPVGLAKAITDLTFGSRILANTYLDFKLAKGFTFRTTFGGNIKYSKNNFYATRQIGLGAGSNGVAAITSAQDLNWLNENTLNYVTTVGTAHTINALLGYSTQGSDYEDVAARARNFNDDFASYNNIGAGATLVAPGSSAAQWRLVSYIARINYGLNDKYLLTLTARRDGSSRFGPNNKFGFFPSGAFAWKVSNEKFMANQQVFDDLKFRVSYGITGNQEISNYQFLSTITSNSAFLGIPTSINTGGVPSRIANPDLKWEKNTQLDVGLDLGVINNRIQLTTDYYIKTTSDLLFSVNVPQSSGYSSSLQNIGKVENKGIEISVNSINIDNGGFRWSSDFNIAFNRNKIKTLDGRSEFTAGEGSGHLQVFNTVLLKVGESLGSFYGREVAGIFQSQEEINASAQPTAKPGDLRYAALVADGVINDLDRTIIGHAYPKAFGGLNNNFSFKGFDLNIFLQGSYGNDILNFGRFDIYNLNGNNNQSRDVLDRWTPENPGNEVPRANSGGGQRILSSFQIEDGSYLRVKNISLGYNLPQSVIKNAYLKRAKIYVSAQNYITFTKYKGYDPEVSRYGDSSFTASSISQGMDYGGYPSAKTLLVGLNLQF